MPQGQHGQCISPYSYCTAFSEQQTGNICSIFIAKDMYEAFGMPHHQQYMPEYKQRLVI